MLYVRKRVVGGRGHSKKWSLPVGRHLSVFCSRKNLVTQFLNVAICCFVASVTRELLTRDTKNICHTG